MAQQASFQPWLPMTATKNSWQYTTIYGSNGIAIMRLDLDDWSVTEDNQDALEVVQAQMVKYILASVNAHDDLVKALENVRAIIVDGAMTGFNYKDGDWAERLFQSQQVTSTVLAKAKS